MIVTAQDRAILRELAGQVAEIAALPAQRETIALWKALNGLRPVRPMVMIDQVCWHEMNVDDELTLRTAGPFCRDLETRLRRTLYQWKHMRVDMVVEPHINISKVIRSTGMGIEVKEQRAILDPENDVVGHLYLDQLKTEEDVERIHPPTLELDREATAEVQAAARDIFEGLLTVRMQGLFPVYNIWDQLSTWRGAQNVLFDLGDRPEFIHRIMSRLTHAYISLLDQAEEKGLLGYGQATIHCTGAHTDELPAPGFDPNHPRAKDLWTFGMAQIFAAVSPRMHQEFELDYVNQIYDRFGMVYYGCCEPLDTKVDMIKRIPHVRKVSMSPWVNISRGAERLGKGLVFSRKPNPAFLAGPTWNPEIVRQDLQEVQEACARYGTPVEFILKDISTVAYQPQRLWEWAQVAMRIAKQ
jgi:hypothetical protein